MTLPTPFPLARYRFDCMAETPIRLPEYAGSTLRGAFGKALRRTACMTREKECKVCPLYRSCPYPAIFEAPPPLDHALQKFSGIPAPFIIEPPEWGEREYAPNEHFQFHLVLAGRALEQLPLVIHAFQRALNHGIGRGEGTAQLIRVSKIDLDLTETCLYEGPHGQVAAHATDLPPLAPPLDSSETLTLEFMTPLRIQRDSHPLGPDELTPRDFLVTLVRRVALISEFHVNRALDLDFGALAQAASAIESDKALTWRDWTRYSSRQKQEMTLGGCVGSWTLRGKLKPFMPFIHAGLWLHAGKNASFGLGRYRLVRA